MTEPGVPHLDAPLSLTEAARLTGQPKAYLKELIVAGRLAVHLDADGDRQRMRVSRANLVAAGLLKPAAPEPDWVEELAKLVLQQSARLAELEDQRFALGAQLGAALERIAWLEERAGARPGSRAVGPVAPRRSVRLGRPAAAGGALPANVGSGDD